MIAPLLLVIFALIVSKVPPLTPDNVSIKSITFVLLKPLPPHNSSIVTAVLLSLLKEFSLGNIVASTVMAIMVKPNTKDIQILRVILLFCVISSPIFRLHKIKKYKLKKL